MSHLAAYDDVNPVINDGDDEMEDEQEEIPSGPGLVNPILMRRMSQASRGLCSLNPSSLSLANFQIHTLKNPQNV